MISTLFIGRNRFHYEQVESTNLQLMEMIQNQALIEGTVVVAKEQKAGRGQGKNKWISSAGLNLCVSIYLKPSFLSVTEQFELNVLCCLAVKNVLSKHDIKSKLKWPNDIYVGANKISGILIETRIQGEKLLAACLGIGLNVNQDFSNTDLTATSIASLLGAKADVDAVEAMLYAEVESLYLKLKQKGSLMSSYLNELPIGESQTFVHAGIEKQADIKRVLPNGMLQLNVRGEEVLAHHPEWKLKV